MSRPLLIPVFEETKQVSGDLAWKRQNILF